MDELLIDEFSRWRLAKWLQGKSKPTKISGEDWEKLLNAELCVASFEVIGYLVDWFGGQVLEILRVNEKRIYR
jgi:hypothetical protein